MIIALNSLPGSGAEQISRLLAMQMGMKYFQKEDILKKFAANQKKTVKGIEDDLSKEETIVKMQEFLNEK